MWKNPADTIGLRNDKSLPEIWTTTIAIVAIAAFVTGLYAVGIVNVGIVNVQTPTRIRVVPFEKQQTTSPSAYSRRNETISRDLARSCPPGRRRRLPDCIIVGAAKCGTYALLDYLSLNPLVVARRRIPIEINYFNVNYGRGVEWYARQMPCAADTEVVVEKSLYFGNASVPTLVADVTPDVRLLLVVCDPVQRAMSHYLERRTSREFAWLRGRPLEDAFVDARTGAVNATVAFVAAGAYVDFLSAWQEHFPPSRMLVVDGNALHFDPVPEMNRIERYLGVPENITGSDFFLNEKTGFLCLSRRGKCLPKNKGRRHPPFPAGVKEKLREFFLPRNEAFFSSVGRRFDW